MFVLGAVVDGTVVEGAVVDGVVVEGAVVDADPLSGLQSSVPLMEQHAC